MNGAGTRKAAHGYDGAENGGAGGTMHSQVRRSRPFCFQEVAHL